MKTAQLVVWLLPMSIVSFFNSVQGVTLPRVIDSLGLSYTQASFLVVVIQMTGFASMIGGGLFIDRLGAVSLLLASIGLFATAGLLAGVSLQWSMVLLSFGLMGMGVAMIGTSVNTAMARTGPQRAFYLGIMHSTYGFISIVAPLIAALAVEAFSWQRYFQGVAVAAILIGIVVVARATRGTTPGTDEAKVAATSEDESPANGSILTGWETLKRILPVCFGVFCVVGIQRTLVTWGYLFMVETYQTTHAVGGIGVALLWVGIFVGRVGNIPLSLRWPARLLLKWAALFGILCLAVEWSVPSVGAVLGLMVALGLGVSGAFQLGTTWAAEMAPASIGAASSFVMASATLGGAVWPWLTGVLADVAGIDVLRWLLMSGWVLAWATFSRRGRAYTESVS